MRAFEVMKETPAFMCRLTGKDRVLWRGERDHKVYTRERYVFFEDDVAIDPLGKYDAVGPGSRPSMMQQWAEKGCYGFRKDGKVLVVHHRHVKVY